MNEVANDAVHAHSSVVNTAVVVPFAVSTTESTGTAHFEGHQCSHFLLLLSAARLQVVYHHCRI